MKKYLALALIAVMLLAAVPAQAKDCWYYAANGRHDFEQVDVKLPSCTSDGYYLLECRQCGANEKHVTERASGHNWKRISGKDATCTEKGSITYSCKNCSTTTTKTVKVLGHSYRQLQIEKQPSCISEGSELVACIRCGAQKSRSMEKTDHSYGAWQISIEASDTSKGFRSRSCTTCGAKQEEEYYPEGTLYRGVQDEEAVRGLQWQLFELGYLNSKVDGVFGKDTERAVREFAASEALPEDGIAWPAILRRLYSVWSGEPETTPEPTATPTPAPTAEPTPEPTEEPAQAVPYCICGEDGAWAMCENHALIHETAQTLYQSARSDESRMRALRQIRALWQEEMDILYESWMRGAQDEQAQGLILSGRAAFANFMATQESMWKMHFGENAPETLENINGALEEQCMQLCGLVERETEA